MDVRRYATLFIGLVLCAALLGLGVASCGRNRAVQINTKPLTRHLFQSIVVLGVRFIGPRSPPPLVIPESIGSLARRSTPTLLVQPPNQRGYQPVETKRAVIFQHTGQDRCFSFWDKVTIEAEPAQTRTRYVVWKVPPGTYVGPDGSTDSFVAEEGHVVYWGDFAIDADWNVVRSVNVKAAESALGVKVELLPVGKTESMSTGVVCAP